MPHPLSLILLISDIGMCVNIGLSEKIFPNIGLSEKKSRISDYRNQNSSISE